MKYTITTRITDDHFNELVKRDNRAMANGGKPAFVFATMDSDLAMVVTFACNMPSAEFMARIAEGE